MNISKFGAMRKMINKLKMYFMVLIGKHPCTENVPLIQRIKYICKLFRVYGFNKAPKRPQSFTESFSPWNDSHLVDAHKYSLNSIFNSGDRK
jgi:hypothetical protein